MFCSLCCGAVAACARKGKLQQTCAKTIATGSRRRFALLMAGDLRGRAEIDGWLCGKLKLKCYVPRALRSSCAQEGRI